MSTLVEIRSLSKVYQRGRQRIEVLHHINLDVESGEFVALMGPSGSGKTTLLNLIGGLDSPTEGNLAVAGERIDQLGQGALARFPSPSLFVLDAGDGPMHRLQAEALVSLDHLVGLRVDPVHGEVEVDVVGVLVNAEDALLSGQAQLVEKDVDRTLHLFSGRVFALMPGQHVMGDGIGTAPGFLSQCDHFGLP